MQYLGLLIFVHLHNFNTAVRPGFEDDPELCPFTNRDTINGISAEMTPRIEGMKYFRRTSDSREEVPLDKAVSYCRMYNLELAEILDQDDYNEVIAMVKETSWSFWVSIKGKYLPDYGDYHIGFKLADGITRLGFHDFGPVPNNQSTMETFKSLQEGCAIVTPNDASTSGVNWAKVGCIENHDILCQYKKSCYKRSDYVKDPTRPIKRLKPINLPGEEESGYFVSTMQATWPFAKQVCEDAGMSIIWFDDDTEIQAFQQRMSTYSADKAQYSGKPFWTAGRFSPAKKDGNIYAKLYWWKHNTAYPVAEWNLDTAKSGSAESSGGFSKTWGLDQEIIREQKNEPYDEGGNGKEKCVDAIFSPVNSFFTSKCDAHLRFFVCKYPEIVKRTLNRPDSPEPSFLEFCDGDQYIKKRIKECNGEVIFASPEKPQCTCFSGVYDGSFYVST